MSVDTSRVLSKSENIVGRRIENEQILVPIKKKATDLRFIYTTNDVGARIWELIDGERSLEQIADMVAEEYGVSAQQVSEDLQAFAGQLTEADCATETTQASAKR